MRDLLRKTLQIIPFLGFVSIIGIIFYLLDSENSDLRQEIEDLNAQIINQDSTIVLYDRSNVEYQNLIDEIKTKSSDCPPTYGYKLNGKFLSTEELFDELLANWNLVDSLKFELELRNDLLKKIESEWGVKVIDEKNSYSITTLKDSKIQKNVRELQELRALISKVERNYPIKYKINRGEDYITIEFLPNRLDTAMILYPHFKDRIIKEKEGYSIIK